MTPSLTALVGTCVETERELTTPSGVTVPAGAVGEVVGEAWGYLNVAWPGLDGTMLDPRRLRPSSREAWAAYSLRATRRGPWVTLRTERREGLLVIPAQTVGLLEDVPSGNAYLRVEVDADPLTEVVNEAVQRTMDAVERADGWTLESEGASLAWPFARATPRDEEPLTLFGVFTRDVSIELPPWEPDPGAVTVRLRALWEPVRGG